MTTRELFPDDRTGWDRAWSNMPHRSVLAWSNQALKPIFGRELALMVVEAMTVSEDPLEYCEKLLRVSEACPLCGKNTTVESRIAATLHPVFEIELGTRKKRSIAFPVWVHPECLASCPEIAGPAPIPW